MRKILALGLVLAMIVSLAACKNDTSIQTPEVTPPAETKSREINETMTGSKTLALYEVLSGEKFAMDVNFIGAKMTMYRDGDTMYVRVDLLGAMTGSVIISDGKITIFEEYDGELLENDDLTYTTRELEQAHLDKIFELFEWYRTEMMNLGGAIMLENGVSDAFRGRELYFERIESGGDDNVFYFFDEDDNIVGTIINETQMKFFVSPTIPEGAFDIPEGYTEDEDGDFEKRFFRMFGE